MRILSSETVKIIRKAYPEGVRIVLYRFGTDIHPIEAGATASVVLCR